MTTSEPPWDEHGVPKHPHVGCPNCGSPDEVGSYYDEAWCCDCGWRGGLSQMRMDAFDVLLEKSSLSTEEAKAIRAQTPQHVVDKILARVDELEREEQERGNR